MSPRVATTGRHAGKRLSLGRVSVAVLLVLAVVAAAVVVPWYLQRAASAEPTVAGPRWFGGYFDVTAAPVAETPAITDDTAVVLAFIVAASEDECVPSWGAAYSLDEAGVQLDLDRRVARMRQHGADVVVSFGGALNTELAGACETPDALAEAYRAVIDRYGSTTIDLDLENSNLTDEAAGYRRAEAIAILQRDRARQGETLGVWLTLPVARTGLTDAGLAAVRQLLVAGVDLAGVNVMTMDYNTDLAGASMGEAAIEALQATHDQVQALYDRFDVELPSEGAWAVMGATPMIGQNDVQAEVFTLRDAEILNAFAAEKALARLSMWSLNRDRTCGPNYPNTMVVSDSCSGVDQGEESFAALLAAGFDGLPVPAVTPTSAPTPIADDPATAPYPIWADDVAYSAGVRVVWHGNVYSAKWWTLGGTQPDDPTLTATETPWTLVGPVLATDQPFTLPTLPTGTYPDWSADAVFQAGDRVLYEGTPYLAKWWTQGDVPSIAITDRDRSPWSLIEPADATSD